MARIDFTKIVASGNDFVIVGPSAGRPFGQSEKLAQKICDRKFGVGADGLLVLEKSKIADIRMRVFNPDGSEACMCGNGARAAALWLKSDKSKIQTKAGIIEAELRGQSVKIKLTEPKDIKLNMPLELNNRVLRANFINTGVPHTVIFVADVDKIDVFGLGRKIRYHKKFAPQGTNVDFVEVLSDKSIKLRTYERGVEDETLACGTGIVASALITNYQLPIANYQKINVHTRSGETLNVYFNRIENKFIDVWLEGKARIVCKGEYYV